MVLENVLLGLLHVVLYCAIVIFIAFCIVWLFKWLGYGIDPMVYKWGAIIVGLICLIVIVTWLFSLLGLAGTGYALPYRPGGLLR